MFRLVIVGGRLQGVEAAYLGLKAGMHVTVIDQDPKAPARGLCHQFHCLDVCRPNQALRNILTAAQGVLPALENPAVLEMLKELTRTWHLKTVFDWQAFDLTTSKRKSTELFRECHIPVPRAYPAGKAPYIAKPVSESGSRGVRLLAEAHEAGAFLRSAADPDQWMVEEYLEGKAYSMEVVGVPGNYRTYALTEIIVDEGYDCCQVLAPCPLVPRGAVCQLSDHAITLAEKLALRGIMDVEVIETRGTMNVLEIDARIPSQTPTVVYHSTGVNLLSELVQVCLTDEFATRPWEETTGQNKWVSYEHLVVTGDALVCQGEHVMSDRGPLYHQYGFFGADEALTNYREGVHDWAATLINTADTQEGLVAKRAAMMEKIRGLQKGMKA